LRVTKCKCRVKNSAEELPGNALLTVVLALELADWVEGIRV
jgi:hypothetical protein